MYIYYTYIHIHISFPNNTFKTYVSNHIQHSHFTLAITSLLLPFHRFTLIRVNNLPAAVSHNQLPSVLNDLSIIHSSIDHLFLKIRCVTSNTTHTDVFFFSKYSLLLLHPSTILVLAYSLD